MVTGPLRAALARGESSAPWPAVVSLALLLSLLTFFTTYANPLTGALEVNLGAGIGQALGVFVQATLLGGVALFAARAFTLPPLGLTLLVTLGSALMLLVHANFALLPAPVGAGLVADAGYAWLRPGPSRARAFQAFAALVPATAFAFSLFTLALDGALRWTYTLTAGAVSLAALCGWLLSFVLPPKETP